MEHIKVSDLASEFEIQYSVVISELKKIGVWVPSADTPVDHDIANRIRRRLQLIVDTEQDEQARAERAKDKKKIIPPKARKTIKELGQPRKAGRKVEEKPVDSPLGASLKPRKGKAAFYRHAVPEEELAPQEKSEELPVAEEPMMEAAHAGETLAEATAEAPPEVELEEVQAAPEVSEEEVAAAASAEAVPAEEPGEIPAAGAVEAVETTPAVPATEKPEAVKAPEAVAKPGVAEPAKEKPIVLKTTAPEPVAPRPPISRRLIRREEPRRQTTPPAHRRDVRPPAQRPAPAAAAPEKPKAVYAPRDITLPETVSVKELSEKLGVKSKDVLKELLSRGMMVSINHVLEQQAAEEICKVFGATPRFVTFEEAVMSHERTVDGPENQVTRAPVVTVMGHVDHGKTSLLDAIRRTKVAAGEAGGITQHIGAYHVNINNRRIVFLDTPGHEAFTLMRARGAQATDIVVLVVAADDGVMPQTVEAIHHARAAGVPILVAINKIDKPEADVQRVKQDLTKYDLLAENWGGDTVMVEVSAKEKANLDLLLEMILLVADMLELKANPSRPASGVVLEAKLDKGRGTVATVLVQNGTIRIGDSFIAGAAYGKLRAMFDDRGNHVNEAGPSSAVEILGLQSIPQAGDVLQVVDDGIKARQIGEYRQEKLREKEMTKSSRVSLDELYQQMLAGEVKELPIVLKADAQGSVEVLQETLKKLSTEKVKIRIIHSGVGAISESDVLLASASNAIVIGFNVRPEQNAQAAAEHEEVDVRLYTVIYDIGNEIKKAMIGLLEPTLRESYMGRAEIRQIFRVPKFGTVGGSYVLDGTISRNSEIRLLRDNVVIYEGRINSLRRFKEDVNQVRSGYECGISVTNFNDLQVGDVVEAFVKEKVEPQLI
jgi:translation initiation factor IF-2